MHPPPLICPDPAHLSLKLVILEATLVQPAIRQDHQPKPTALAGNVLPHIACTICCNVQPCAALCSCCVGPKAGVPVGVGNLAGRADANTSGVEIT